MKKPSSVHLYGRNFIPSRDELFQILGAAFKRFPQDLSPDHLDGVTIHRTAIDGQSQHEFFGVVPRTQMENPGARVLDLVIPDEKNGKDMAIVFIWGKG